MEPGSGQIRQYMRGFGGKKGALYTVLIDGLLNIIKSKLKSNTGHMKADEVNYSLWLLETLEDIMINFEYVAVHGT